MLYLVYYCIWAWTVTLLVPPLVFTEEIMRLNSTRAGVLLNISGAGRYNVIFRGFRCKLRYLFGGRTENLSLCYGLGWDKTKVLSEARNACLLFSDIPEWLARDSSGQGGSKWLVMVQICHKSHHVPAHTRLHQFIFQFRATSEISDLVSIIEIISRSGWHGWNSLKHQVNDMKMAINRSLANIEIISFTLHRNAWSP